MIKLEWSIMTYSLRDVRSQMSHTIYGLRGQYQHETLQQCAAHWKSLRKLRQTGRFCHWTPWVHIALCSFIADKKLDKNYMTKIVICLTLLKLFTFFMQTTCKVLSALGNCYKLVLLPITQLQLVCYLSYILNRDCHALFHSCQQNQCVSLLIEPHCPLCQFTRSASSSHDSIARPRIWFWFMENVSLKDF